MKPIGIAILGTSFRSTMLVNYLKRNPDQGFLTGLYDQYPARCDIFREEFALDESVRIYGSLDEALDDERTEAVFIGTWDSAHVQPTVAALQAGKHVYCEKPMATTLADCDAIIAAARNAQSVFYMGMNLRHGPVHETLHETLASGRLGKLLTIEANEYYYGGRTYFRRWNRLREYGGGLWITKACHDFDLLNWFAGTSPRRIYGTSNLSFYRPRPEAGPRCSDCPIEPDCPESYFSNPREPIEPDSFRDRLGKVLEENMGYPRDICLFNGPTDTFDNGMAVIDYDNDIRASYCVNVVAARGTRQMNLMGTEGSAEGDMTDGRVRIWDRHKESCEEIDLRERMNSGHGGADDNILTDFFRCCRTGDKPRSSWTDGRASVALGLAVRESCDTGQPVELKD